MCGSYVSLCVFDILYKVIICSWCVFLYVFIIVFSLSRQCFEVVFVEARLDAHCKQGLLTPNSMNLHSHCSKTRILLKGKSSMPQLNHPKPIKREAVCTMKVSADQSAGHIEIFVHFQCARKSLRSQMSWHTKLAKSCNRTRVVRWESGVPLKLLSEFLYGQIFTRK